MDLDELRSVRRTERQKDSLQHLRDSFYEDVADYIAERKAERRRAAEAADDPFGDPEVGQLTDEIGTAEDVVEAIYERRVGKVVKLASFAAADMSADKSGLTVEERALFDDLVERIKRNRRSVLDTLAGEGGDGSGVDIDVDAAPATPGNADTGSAGVDTPSTDPDGTPDTGSADADPDPTAAASDAGTRDSTVDRPAGDPTPAESEGTPPEPDDPPAPDDVLAAAMGGDDTAEPNPDAGAGTEPQADTEREPAPPDAEDDLATDPDRDVPVVDGAETDGGAATVTADDVAEPGPTGGPPSRDGNDAERAPDSGAAGGTDDPGEDRVTLRITADVGRIYGVDEREYDLESEDVVRLPATNAGPLVERGAAERLE